MKYFIPFAIGVLSSLIATVFYSSFKTFLGIFKKKEEVSISGFWIARFPSLSPPDSIGYEIIRIVEYGDDTVLYIDNYNQIRKSIMLYKGRGKFRGKQISAFCYRTDDSQFEIGAFILKLFSTNQGKAIFQGSYYQLLERQGNKIDEIGNQRYCMERVNINITRRIRRFLCKSHYSSFEDLESNVVFSPASILEESS